MVDFGGKAGWHHHNGYWECLEHSSNRGGRAQTINDHIESAFPGLTGLF